MKDTVEEQPSKARERLEQEAERVRSRLLDDLDELKARGRSVSDRVEEIRATVKQHPGVLVGVAAAAVVTAGVLFFVRRSRRRRELRRDAILGLAARLLGPAYVVEPKDRRQGVIKDSVKKAGGALVAAAGRELGRRALLALAAPGDEHHGENHAPA